MNYFSNFIKIKTGKHDDDLEQGILETIVEYVLNGLTAMVTSTLKSLGTYFGFLWTIFFTNIWISLFFVGLIPIQREAVDYKKAVFSGIQFMWIIKIQP